jgi:hypothetical protein
MLPCLRITFTSSNLPQHRSFAHGKALNRLLPHALRRGNTTVAQPPLEEKTAEEVPPLIDSTGLEFLCNLGMDAASATAVLGKVTTSAPVDAAHLESLCFVLHTIVKIPVAKFPELFLNADSELLTLSSATISTNYKAICSAWPSETQLRDSIISYPGILTSTFPKELQRCITSLRDMGFSTIQTAAAVVRCPELTSLRRYEITSALAQCGINPKIEDEEMFEMLSRNPKFLTPEGSKNLNIILEAVKKATGLTAQQAQHIVARCSGTIFQYEKKDIRKICDLLLEFGLTQPQVGQAAMLFPNLMCRKISRVEQTLAILSTYQVTPTQVATYPHIFSHNPEKTIAPRLAFLKKTAPEKIETLSLASLFCCTDETFSAQFSKSSEKTYQRYKINALVRLQMGTAAAARDAAKVSELSVDFTDGEQEEKEERSGGGQQTDEGKEVVVARKSSGDAVKNTFSRSIPQQQKNEGRRPPVAASNEKKTTQEGGEKQESSEEKRKQQQQQGRRFFKRTNSSSKPKNKGQQQQLQRLTPEQLEKSIQNSKSKIPPSPPPKSSQ